MHIPHQTTPTLLHRRHGARALGTFASHPLSPLTKRGVQASADWARPCMYDWHPSTAATSRGVLSCPDPLEGHPTRGTPRRSSEAPVLVEWGYDLTLAGLHRLPRIEMLRPKGLARDEQSSTWSCSPRSSSEIGGLGPAAAPFGAAAKHREGASKGRRSCPAIHQQTEQGCVLGGAAGAKVRRDGTGVCAPLPTS